MGIATPDLSALILHLKDPKVKAALGVLSTATIATLIQILRTKHEELPKIHRKNSAVILSDGSREIYVPYKNEEAKVIINPTKIVTFEAHRRLFLDKRSAAPVEGKVGVNRRFIRQFEAIWAILVPRFQSKETAILFLHACFLIARTWLSLVVARLDGTIVRDLVSANGKGFMRGLAFWFLIAVPATYTNSMIQYLQAKISIGFRTRLIRYVHDLYLNSNLSFYKITLDGQLTGADQYITTDITKFCDTVSSLYSSIGKPSVDIVVFTYQLFRSIGPLGMVMIFANYFGTAYLLRKVSPSFGRLAVAEARLEGDFRNAHSRIVTSAEEIAFYGGEKAELRSLDKAYLKLIRHVNGIFKILIAYNMFEDFIIKYAWSALGLICCSLPVFLPNLGGLSEGSHEHNRTKAFITNKRLLLSLSDAGGRIMYSYKDLAELAGYTARVYALLSTLHRVHANAYKPSRNERAIPYSFADIKGTVQEGFEGIRLESVPVVIPSAYAGEELFSSLSFIIRPGEHMIISGPNGIGKTAIARVIAGLWPVYQGLLSKPSSGEIIYIPQRPYLSIGTLREQIIYPQSHHEMVTSGKTDEDLMEILRIVRLEYLPGREGGLDAKQNNWGAVFSGGEKQRMSLARMFYHMPKFAVLDEATSAVSSDVEGILYEKAKEFGITLLTISHRPGLVKYHKYLLKLDGEGIWEIQRVGTEKELMSVEREIQDLECRLAQVEGWTRRHKEVEQELRME
ncbi:ATP-binding cassette sub-family D member 2 [Neolecta irregularis DAH-3]|uniref:ATP-binding cassette sub-family D member 2 n=1 Tax=Neolecta irregularis (strain DAH-3) TaxID=1198029 RepID=A0A1U7LGI1_NEOID|nr:ATP-binding cassette sub-family D member 2 [Neolecta irregularis DAH-3]|eukprot:OLL21757.1 ATP-binding cassette sub-family D member 2 [Neolecta irregularis DAH-3]